MEIIIVDNASTDGSPEAVEIKYPDVRLIKNNHNYGFARGNNIGIKESNGRYICLINSDVKVLSNCLTRLYEYIENNQSIGIISPRILNSDITIQCTCRHFPSLWNSFCSATALYRLFPQSEAFSGDQMFYFKHDAILSVEVLAGCFLMVRREAFEQAGYLDDQFFMYAEDIDWCKRFHQAGWQIVFFPDAEAIHYGGASSANSPLRFSVAQEKSLFQYWAKHHGTISRFALFCIIILQHTLRIISESLLYVFKPTTRARNQLQLQKHFSCLRSLFRT
jgi:GT2 family glycosyltransferase